MPGHDKWPGITNAMPKITDDIYFINCVRNFYGLPPMPKTEEKKPEIPAFDTFSLPPGFEQIFLEENTAHIYIDDNSNAARPRVKRDY